MNKYKVCVYAICKNEEKHIKRWFNSMKEADEIYVLDTGSSDNSVNLLKELGVNVKVKKYNHFKFDKARNDSLSLVPMDTDICVCTDLDETFNKGWRKELEELWNNKVDRIKYILNFSFDNLGKPVTTYYISKIHTRKHYKWIYNVHEVLKFNLNRKENIITSNIEINHYPDISKDRSFYLDLLINEKNKDDTTRYYLAREYMYNKQFNKAIDSFIKHINTSNFLEEKSSSLRYIGICYKELNNLEESLLYFKQSIELTPNIREGYVLLGLLYYEMKEYSLSIEYLEKAKDITNKSLTYINEEYAWNETLYDILSLDYFYIGNITKSLDNINKALEINPYNERIIKNKQIIKSLI